MKILQVNCVYAKGSTGKIAEDLHKGLKKRGFESVVCYGRGKRITEDGVYKTCTELESKLHHLNSRFTGMLYNGCYFATKKLISIIKKEKPDIVHIQCINGYFVNIYKFVEWLKINKIKTVLTLHAEFMYTGGCGHSIDCNQWSTRTGCGHSGCPRWRADTKSIFFDRTSKAWKKMKDAFDGFDDLVVVSVSPWLMERAKRSPIFEDKTHCMIFNGLNTDVFHVCDTEDLKAKHKIANEKIIFHATAYFSDDADHIKGGYYVIKLAERLKAENYKVIVAGSHGDLKNVPENVILLGEIKDQSLLAKYYSMADVTVVTSKRETFSMVVAESLCCGTPVAGFKAGAPEQIALSEYSGFVENGNLDELVEMTKKISKLKTESAVIAEKAADTYSKTRMLENYLKIYNLV